MKLKQAATAAPRSKTCRRIAVAPAANGWRPDKFTFLRRARGLTITRAMRPASFTPVEPVILERRVARACCAKPRALCACAPPAEPVTLTARSLQRLMAEARAAPSSPNRTLRFASAIGPHQAPITFAIPSATNAQGEAFGENPLSSACSPAKGLHGNRRGNISDAAPQGQLGARAVRATHQAGTQLQNAAQDHRVLPTRRAFGRLRARGSACAIGARGISALARDRPARRARVFLRP